MKRKIPLVYVEWYDATGNTAWSTVEELEKEKPALVREVGWVHSEKDGILKIVSQFCDDSDVGNHSVIPSKWIKYKRILRVKI